MLRFQELKLSRFLNEENANLIPNPDRVKDITRALKRVTENIAMWEHRLESISNQPPRPPERPAIGSDDPLRPYIG